MIQYMDKGDNSGHVFVTADTEKELRDTLDELTLAGFKITEGPERYATGKHIASVWHHDASTMIELIRI